MTIHEIIDKYEWLLNRIKHPHTRQTFRECLAGLKAYVEEQERNDVKPPKTEKPVRVPARPKRRRKSNAGSGDVETAKAVGARSVPAAPKAAPRVADKRQRDVGRKADEVPSRHTDVRPGSN